MIDRHVVREHGVALAGPDPRTLIDPVDAGDLRDAVVSLLHGWWMPAPTCRRWLDNPFYRSYAVLTMCRMRYTLQYSVVVSKPITARWAQAALDARWEASHQDPGRCHSTKRAPPGSGVPTSRGGPGERPRARSAAWAPRWRTTARESSRRGMIAELAAGPHD